MTAKRRYTLQVHSPRTGHAEYFINATAQGLEDLKASMKADISYSIMDGHGIIHRVDSPPASLMNDFTPEYRRYAELRARYWYQITDESWQEFYELEELLKARESVDPCYRHEVGQAWMLSHKETL